MIEELMAYLLSVDCDDKWDELSDLFEDKYGLNIEQFDKLVSDLVPLCAVGKSPLTGTVFRGFIDETEGVWLIKGEMKI